MHNRNDLPALSLVERPVIVTSMASDSHTWNLVFLQLRLEEMGRQVVNLGPCVPDDVLIDMCLRLDPELVVISSVNGHGFIDGMRVIGRLRGHAGLHQLPVVIGGKLGVHGADTQHVADLLAAGFDAVFPDGSGLAEFESFVRAKPMGVPC